MFEAKTPLTDAAEKECCCTVNGAIIRGIVTADFARRLERELYGTRICAGVASKERGEWAAEREALKADRARLVEALRKSIRAFPPHLRDGLESSALLRELGEG